MVDKTAKAVVFSAFVLPPGAGDVREHREQQEVEKVCKALIDNFQDAKTVGLVYVFIADGYQAILNSTEPTLGLAKERRIRRILQSEIDERGAEKFQIVGTNELIPALDGLTRTHKGRLAELFLGRGERMYYDSPKIIEAIIRLARGNFLEPILRIDADVKVNDDAVEELIGVHEAQHAARRLHPIFFFSGGYRVHDPTRQAEEWLLNDFAARVHFIGHGAGPRGRSPVGTLSKPGR